MRQVRSTLPYIHTYTTTQHQSISQPSKMIGGDDFTKSLSELLSQLGDGTTDLLPSPSPPTPHPLCNICHHFEPGLSTSTPTADFLRFSCLRCAIDLQVLDVVTDIRRPEFIAVELERKEWPRSSWDPKGVLRIICVQKGRFNPVTPTTTNYDNPFPHKYSVYTPAGEFCHSAHAQSLSQCEK
jgi:hypothetical protein